MKDIVTIENVHLYEFILNDFTSLFFDIDKKKWIAEYLDMEDDGEEYTEYIPDLENLDSLVINMVKLEKEELNTFLEIVKGEFNED